MTFLLELCLLFVGTISTCFAGKISFLLEPHYCLLEPYQLFVGTMCFAFQTSVAIFCCNRGAPTATASSERPTVGSQRSFEVVRARIDGVRVCFLSMHARQKDREGKGKRKEI